MPLMRPYLMFFLGWLFPGLGHAAQKKFWRAAIFCAGILGMLGMGLAMQGKFYNTESMHPLLLLGFFGDLGNGIFFFAVKLLGLAEGDIHQVTFHYGTTYMACAGLLNYLAALHAFDIARGKKQ
jgi:hypothetical protein